MKLLSILVLFLGLFLNANAQKYITRDGYIGFFSHAPVEDIKADNNQVASVIDTSTGDIVFQVLIRSFHFVKTVMEEHFNENYLESDKFPKSTFKGKIVNLSDINFSKPGTYNATVEGDITIHDITKKVTENGTFEVVDGGINAKAKFNIAPEDYKITIPSVVRNNIAKIVEVTVAMKYTPLEGK